MAIRFIVDFAQFRDALGRFQKLESLAEEQASDVAERTATRVVAALKRAAPRNKLSKTPGATIANRIVLGNVSRSRGRFEAEIILPPETVFTRPPGVRPHTIKPKGTGYALTFYWHRFGRTVSFMSVNHPGYKVAEEADWVANTTNTEWDLAEAELRKAGKIRSFGLE